MGFQGKKDLVAVDTTEYEGGDGEADDSDNEKIKDGSEHSSSDLDSDEERQRWLTSSIDIVPYVLFSHLYVLFSRNNEKWGVYSTWIKELRLMSWLQGVTLGVIVVK